MGEGTYKLLYLLMGFGGLGLTAYGLFNKKEEGPPPKKMLEQGASFLLLGDSIGVGLQKPMAKLSEAYGSYMDSETEIGTSVTYWANHITNSEAGFDLTLLSLGSNDVVGDPAHEAAAMDSLIGTLQSRGATVAWIVPPSFRLGNFTPKQELFAQMLADRGVFPIPIEGPQPSVAEDPMHLHPTPAGYAAYAAQIFTSITTPR